MGEIVKRKSLNEYSSVRSFSYKVSREFKEAVELKVDRVFGSEMHLYFLHKDMFNSRSEISKTVADILQGFEFKKDAKRSGGVILGKAISDKKMIDIGINLKDGVIFHANKKKWNKSIKEARSKR